MRYLTVKEVIAINQLVISLYSPGEQIGVKNYGLLESAIFRPQSTDFQEEAYPSINEKAAALFQSLANNLPFHNANKRTAFISLMQFLSYNGFEFAMPTQKDQEDFTVDVVKHKLSFDSIVTTIYKYKYKSST